MNEKPAEAPKESSFSLSIGHFFPEDENNEFEIGFLVNIDDVGFKIKLEMLFVFQVDQLVDDDFKQSDFIKINAPAIAFPYVRSYVSNLTLQSGFDPIILPSVNFVRLNESQKDSI